VRRKLKYHVACTVDGFVAEGEHVTDYLASLKSDYDIVLMGRRTYEFGFQLAFLPLFVLFLAVFCCGRSPFITGVLPKARDSR